MRSVPPRGSGWVCTPNKIVGPEPGDLGLIATIEPTRYREVVLTSSPRSNWLDNQPLIGSNTQTEHYPVLGLLDAPRPICYKNFSALKHGSRACDGVYSAVAQWQSIRLLTEGL